MSSVPATAPVAGGRPRIRGHRGGVLGDRALRALLLAPVVALLVLFFLWPLLEIVLRSLNSEGVADYGFDTLSLGHYADIVRNDVVRSVALRTLAISALSASAAARSTTFSSSRTLPGYCCCTIH